MYSGLYILRCYPLLFELIYCGLITFYHCLSKSSIHRIVPGGCAIICTFAFSSQHHEIVLVPERVLKMRHHWISWRLLLFVYTIYLLSVPLGTHYKLISQVLTPLAQGGVIFRSYLNTVVTVREREYSTMYTFHCTRCLQLWMTITHFLHYVHLI